MLPFPSLRHIAVTELNHPELVDNTVFKWFDDVRHTCGIPWRLTSDARTEESNNAAGGSPTSLHRLGRAIDFTVKSYDAATLWKIFSAIALTPPPGGCGVEFEVVVLPVGGMLHHLHLGLFPDTRPSRFIVKVQP
jgi:uncharacterized protein YcbK (DUF882 family)